ncbi:MAG TPA: 4Fe-4S binding protein [Syntrophales bacterium]|nr:4Fe-4S binding protein [Syntrophales bacterium]
MDRPAAGEGVRPIIRINEDKCDGCGLCVLECAEKAIDIVNGKAKLVSDIYCDGLGACLSECPRGAIELVEREAEPFDEKAAESRKRKGPPQQDKEAPACGCPSSRVIDLRPRKRAGRPQGESVESGPANWPVQIRLVPPGAAFLKGADLLVAADCTAFACPAFHMNFVKGRVVLVGCPKLDDQELNLNKLAEIFSRADVRTVTAAVMEVPCCQGLPILIRKAMSLAGRDIPLETVVITTGGEIR